MSNDDRKTEWTPEGGEGCFATRYVPGSKDSVHPASCAPPKKPVRKRPPLDPAAFARGVLAADRTLLGRAITLVESNAPRHLDAAQEMLKILLPHTGKSVRLGITGFPGAGKSTFIEALGNHLCDLGKKVAVLAVDPTSSLSKGSILGDKTRMERLTRRPEAFIRPSPSGGVLGGVARKSRETILVCEAAGFDVILVETVGVGQSEVMVRSMVDFFLLVMISGAGDELQGIKRGIMELADAILINKADGDNKIRAEQARSELELALHYLQPATPGWETRALTASALTEKGVPEAWSLVEKFAGLTTESGVFSQRRESQTISWVHSLVEEQLKSGFYGDPAIKAALPIIEGRVSRGELSPTQAARDILAVKRG